MRSSTMKTVGLGDQGIRPQRCSVPGVQLRQRRALGVGHRKHNQLRPAGGWFCGAVLAPMGLFAGARVRVGVVGLVPPSGCLVCRVPALGSWRGHSWAVHSMISRGAGLDGLIFSPLRQRPICAPDAQIMKSKS
jgi:hypothetical protein